MARETRLRVVFVINASLIASLVVVGLAAHSLALLAAAGDYVADGAAIALALLSLRLTRRQPTERHSFGYHRASVLAALVNGVVIVSVVVTVSVEATQRLLAGARQVNGGPTLVVAVIAFLGMGACALLVTGDHDISIRSVLLDTAGDAAAAAGVAIAALVILVTGGTYWADPAIALVISVVVFFHGISLLRQVTHVLMESTPRDLDLAAVSAAICRVPGVAGVHDLHVWSLSSDVTALSAHLDVAETLAVADAQTIGRQVKATLAAKFSIDHPTLEFESRPCNTDGAHCGIPFAQTPLAVSE